jgi:hypothetical protein
MPDIIPTLRLYILPGIGEQKAQEGGLKEWILKGTYVPELGLAGEIILRNVSIKALVPYINYDFERFCLSSRESFEVSAAERTSNNLAGWPLLKLYYSAFFSAHSLLRVCGAGVTKLDRVQLNHLNQVLNVYSPGQQFGDAGSYYFSIDVPVGYVAGQIDLTFKPSADGAGVHDGFWRLFCNFLTDKAADAVRTGQSSNQSFLADITEITSALKNGSGSGGSWISSIRNEVNYQHLHDAWFPFKKSSKNLEYLSRVTYSESKSLRIDGDKRKVPIDAFVNICRYMACLNIDIGDVIAKRGTGRDGFAAKWKRLAAIFEQ